MIVDDILIACDKIKALALMFSDERDIYYYLARTRLDRLAELMTNQKQDADYQAILTELDEIIKILEEDEDVQASV